MAEPSFKNRPQLLEYGTRRMCDSRERKTDILGNVSLDEDLVRQPCYRFRDTRIRTTNPENLEF